MSVLLFVWSKFWITLMTESTKVPNARLSLHIALHAFMVTLTNCIVINVYTPPLYSLALISTLCTKLG